MTKITIVQVKCVEQECQKNHTKKEEKEEKNQKFKWHSEKCLLIIMMRIKKIILEREKEKKGNFVIVSEKKSETIG